MTEINKQNDVHAESLAVQALGEICPVTGALVPPLQLATTYARDADYNHRDGRSYIRDSSPTVEQAEKIICSLEEGSQALLFPSGLSACTASFHALKAGDHVAVGRTLYHGLTHWLEEFAPRYGIDVDFFDHTDVGSLETAVQPDKTKLVWAELMANPTWDVADIAALADITHKAGARLALDATAATPVLCQPLLSGADLVCHSATKFLNGHSDVLAGVLVCKNAESALWQRVRSYRHIGGPMPSARDAYELIRGMKTVYLRVRQQSHNALAVATMLEKHPFVEFVYYPGLSTNPNHELATRQLSGGYGGMLSFLVKGGRDEAIKVALSTRLWKPATSLGGVESLIEHRKSSEGDITDTPENLIRLSTGIEHVEDLLADLDQALNSLR